MTNTERAKFIDSLQSPASRSPGLVAMNDDELEREFYRIYEEFRHRQFSATYILDGMKYELRNRDNDK